MPYPETFEGYMIKDQSKWTDFEKKEVSSHWVIAFTPTPVVDSILSLNPRSSKIVISISRLNVAVFAVLMSIPSLAVGATAHFRSVLAMRLLVRLSKSATR